MGQPTVQPIPHPKQQRHKNTYECIWIWPAMVTGDSCKDHRATHTTVISLWVLRKHANHDTPTGKLRVSPGHARNIRPWGNDTTMVLSRHATQTPAAVVTPQEPCVHAISSLYVFLLLNLLLAVGRQLPGQHMLPQAYACSKEACTASGCITCSNSSVQSTVQLRHMTQRPLSGYVDAAMFRAPMEP